jgi:hypothetical protein
MGSRKNKSLTEGPHMNCKFCGKDLEGERGPMYGVNVCEACCIEKGICQDCGGPVEVDNLNFACTGFHYLKGDILLQKSLVKFKCPKCGYEETVK